MEIGWGHYRFVMILRNINDTSAPFLSPWIGKIGRKLVCHCWFGRENSDVLGEIVA